jgi:hypothetical protein
LEQLIVPEKAAAYVYRGAPRPLRESLLSDKASSGEGRKRAQARGVRFGRPPALTAHQRAEALQRLAAGETQTDIARSYNVSHVTIGRLQGPFSDPVSASTAAA